MEDRFSVLILDENVEDMAVWRSNNGIENSFKISTVWKDISQQEEKVDWHPLVWSLKHSKHAFVPWLAIRERNNRIFKQEKRDANTMVNLIKENTRLKLIGLKVKDSVTVKEVERRWQIQMKKV
ncbi:hypothetical protein Tco_0538073 [Tanacetum coccineum]